MKVKDFLKQFENVDPEMEIIISSDPEGNSYYKGEIDICESAYNDFDGDIEIGLRELTPELMKQGYNVHDVAETPCIVIYP